MVVGRLEELNLEESIRMDFLKLRRLVDFRPDAVHLVFNLDASLVEVLYFVVEVSDYNEDLLDLVGFEQTYVHFHDDLDDAILRFVTEVLRGKRNVKTLGCVHSVYRLRLNCN